MTCKIPPRPKRNDPDIVRKAAHLLVQKISTWCHRKGVTPDLMLIAGCYVDDGYKFARNLEAEGWQSDFALTNLLQIHAKNCADEAIDEAVAAWVKANSLKVPFSGLQFVALPWCAKGQIIDINHRLAMITVHPVAEDAMWSGDSDSGWVIGYELATPFLGTVGELAQ